MIVISLAGHDMGRIYLVTRDEGKCALVCDGKEHRINNPKHKNKKHLCQILESIVIDPEGMTDGILRKKLSLLTKEYERVIN